MILDMYVLGFWFALGVISCFCLSAYLVRVVYDLLQERDARAFVKEM